MSTVAAANLKDLTLGTSVPMKYPVQGSAKAWGNVNQQGTQAISASFNFSSITDTGVGKTLETFTSAFSSSNYGLSGYMRRDDDTDSSTLNATSNSSDTKSTSAFAFKCVYVNNGGAAGLTDSPVFGSSFFGTLA